MKASFLNKILHVNKRLSLLYYQLYFSFMNCYLNYIKLIRASANKSKLQALY